MIANELRAKLATLGKRRYTRLFARVRFGAIRARRLRVLLSAAAIAILATLWFPAIGIARQLDVPSDNAPAEQQKKMVNEARANKDVDVGTFYMHKGDYSAAISRFEEAAQLDPRNPKAQLLLAESYEKHGDRTRALAAYRQYLKSFPDSRDDKKIRKKIAELSRKRD